MIDYNSEYIADRRYKEKSNPGVHGAFEANELTDIKNDIINLAKDIVKLVKKYEGKEDEK